MNSSSRKAVPGRPEIEIGNAPDFLLKILDGVHFDFDYTFIRPEAKPIIREIVDDVNEDAQRQGVEHPEVDIPEIWRGTLDTLNRQGRLDGEIAAADSPTDNRPSDPESERVAAAMRRLQQLTRRPRTQGLER